MLLALAAATSCTLDHELPVSRALHADDAGDPRAREPTPPPRCGPDRVPQGAPNLPRNVLFFLGDGMGVEHVAAGRALAGGKLRLDALAHVTRLNTDSTTTDADPFLSPTDSAAGATAFATGTRVGNGRLSLGDDGARLPSALDLAQQQGKAVGLVTTSFLYDASPMAFAVHVASRNAHQDIVEQLVTRAPIDVLMGGASGLLDPAFAPWRAQAEALGYRIVTSTAAMTAEPAQDERLLLGLFTPQPTAAPTYAFPMTPALERTAAATDPTLAEMTERALELLARDSDGFFLFVENEHIDSYSHLGPSTPEASRQGVPHEVLALDEAVGVGLEWVETHSSFAETLVVVSADHECGDYRHHPQQPLGGVFGSSGHTRAAVEAYASGPGSERLDRLCRTSDLFALLTGRPY